MNKHKYYHLICIHIVDFKIKNKYTIKHFTQNVNIFF